MKDRDIPVQDKFKALQGISRELGFKLTHQRLEIFHVVATAENHPSAEEVYKRVRPKMPTISFDTVYRTLAFFERQGVIDRVQHLDDRTRYDPNTSPHYHLVCTRCKKIQDLYWPTLDDLEIPEETSGWGEIKGKYLELRGICQECLDKEKVKPRG